MRHKIFIAGLLIWSIFVLPTNGLFAATAETVNQQISETNAQIQALDREIKQYQDQISLTSGQSRTLANLIKELTLTRNKLLKETAQTEKKITATSLIIGSLEENISEQQKSINNSKVVLSKMFRDLHERDNTGVLYQLISETSLTDASHEYDNVVTLNKSITSRVTELENQISALSESKNLKQSEQKNLVTLKKDLTNKKLAVDVTKKEKDTLLAETKNKESNYKKLLEESQRKRDLFESDLAKYETQLKFILNPNLLPTSGTSTLSWPLDNVFVTQLFGKTSASKRLYTSGSHSGVDFRASTGTSVKSMGNGTVIGTGDTDIYCKGASFGKWVFIKYDNGLSSTFGHLSVITSSAGQKVSTGDVVGLSGNTGHSTGPHLHVTVYASQGADVKTVPSLSCNGKVFIMPIAPVSAYLDPMLYLPALPLASVKK